MASDSAADPAAGPPAPPVPLRRSLAPGIYPLDEVAPGLLLRPIVDAFAPPIPRERLVAHAHVQVTRDDSWPRVHEHKGHIQLPRHYLQGAQDTVLYLDLVHELVHVRQFLEGRVLYHREMDYVDWPTEIEAYRFTVAEARTLGCTDAWIREYLEIPWADGAGMARLYRSCGVSSL